MIFKQTLNKDKYSSCGRVVIKVRSSGIIRLMLPFCNPYDKAVGLDIMINVFNVYFSSNGKVKKTNWWRLPSALEPFNSWLMWRCWLRSFNEFLGQFLHCFPSKYYYIFYLWKKTLFHLYPPDRRNRTNWLFWASHEIFYIFVRQNAQNYVCKKATNLSVHGELKHLCIYLHVSWFKNQLPFHWNDHFFVSLSKSELICLRISQVFKLKLDFWIMVFWKKVFLQWLILFSFFVKELPIGFCLPYVSKFPILPHAFTPSFDLCPCHWVKEFTSPKLCSDQHFAPLFLTPITAFPTCWVGSSISLFVIYQKEFFLIFFFTPLYMASQYSACL